MPKTTPAQHRIMRTARRLRLVTFAAILLLAAATVFAVAVLVGAIPAALAPYVRIDTDGLAGAAAALVIAVPAGLLGGALIQLAAMLRIVGQGTPFAAAGHLRRFAFYLFLAVLAGVLLPPLVAMIASGSRGATFALAGGEALMLFVTGLLFFVARLLEEAQRVADEHGQIV